MNRNRQHLPFIVLALLLALTALQLHHQGRLWTASSGNVHFWVSDTFSSENSQHLFDPYSFSHMQHGLIFFFLLRWLFPRLSWSWRFVGSAALEAGWELLENSAFIIDRYRNVTAAFGYTGDTIINSMFDIVCCSAGFLIAYLLGGRKTLALFLVVEITMILWIKDSLLINVLMLIYPFEAIREWQLSP
ncbi:MAG: DUF2585 family protein [Bacteroidota bacterium]